MRIAYGVINIPGDPGRGVVWSESDFVNFDMFTADDGMKASDCVWIVPGTQDDDNGCPANPDVDSSHSNGVNLPNWFKILIKAFKRG